MARESLQIVSTVPLEIQKINLSRMMLRFHQILITPDSDTEENLLASRSERFKLESNLAHADRLLSQLERQIHKTHGISLNYDSKLDIARKRTALLEYSQQLEELNDLANGLDDISDEDDLLEKYSFPDPSCEDLSLTHNKKMKFESPKSPQLTEEHAATTKTLPVKAHPIINFATEFQSDLRARVKSERAELFKTSSVNMSDNLSSAAELRITHNRVEQEKLTTSLLQMASILKSSSQAFNLALEEEKSVLRNATQGLEKNELGLEATHRRMGLLRTFTEGKGWWGRMIMYVWIFAMTIGAIMIVLMLPKLRF